VSVAVVLDTDAVIDVLRRQHGVANRLAELSPDDAGVASMTVAELLYGAAASREPERNRMEVERFLTQVRVIGFARRAAALHAELRWQLRKEPIGPHDLIIAATALAAGAMIVTSNTREFARIGKLTVESWR
jgi:tRNA(fMet)-specific endonuclease VapC